MKIHLHINNTLIALALFAGLRLAVGQGTAFTYQGRLVQGTNTANGQYDLKFLLFDAVSSGVQMGLAKTNAFTAVSNGLFTVSLDFGAGNFNGSNRWLEVSVRTNGSGGFTVLAPRQALTPGPYAIYAGNAASAGTATLAVQMPWTGLTGIPAGFTDGIDNDTRYGAGAGVVLAGTNFGMDSAFADARYWKLLGNGGTIAGTSFLGTTDNQPLELKVNGKRALRLEPTGDSPNLIGGSSANSVGAGIGATISGGGATNAPNKIDPFASAASSFGTIGGGVANLIRDFSPYGTIGGGTNNLIADSSDISTIGGGAHHIVYDYAGTIGGGESNDIDSGPFATIGGGFHNLIGKYTGGGSSYATVGGGGGNSIENTWYGTIAGGIGNHVISAPTVNHMFGGAIGGGQSNTVNESFGTIGGGNSNTIRTNAEAATISGGRLNTVTGTNSSVGGGANNSAGSRSATIAGGTGNSIHPDGNNFSFIGGGASNNIQASSEYCTISGGQGNVMLEQTSGSTIGGGRLNFIGEAFSAAIGGGIGNSIDKWAEQAVIAGGYHNYIATLAAYSTIGGGRDNVVAVGAANSATIGGGEANYVVGGYATIGGGIHNTNSGSMATIGGGSLNMASGAYSTIPGGNQAKASNFGQAAYASGSFVAPGDAQTSTYVCRGTTVGAVTNEIFLDNAAQRMVIPNNSTWTYDILVTARGSSGNSAGYQIRGTIKNNGGNTTLVPSANGFLILGEDVMAWDTAAAADNANDALVIKVTGSAGATIRWVATVRTVEVTF